MNWKGVFAVVLVLGIVLLIWGGVLYIMNQPLAGDDSLAGRVSDAINYFDNRRREGSRNTAMYIMLAGTVVSFAGIGGLVSLKKR
jgi:hypothetical protein